MVEDIRLGSEGRAGVDFFGRVGGLLPTEREIEDKIAEEAN
jgi:2-oxoglutarate ferredoxin oxidoreductase subunit alpha